MNTAVVGVGSNIAPITHICQAKKILANDHTFIAEASWQKTRPIGVVNQPDFINTAFLVETHQSQKDFITYLHGVESQLGRMRLVNKFGPRTIDLDVVMWNGEILDPDYKTRLFLRSLVAEVLSQ